MNVSHKHKTIWLAPEKCATKIVKQLLLGYEFSEQKKDDSFYRLGYKLISSIRNPYDRIFSIFINFELSPVFLNKTLKNEIKQHFNEWILHNYFLPFFTVINIVSLRRWVKRLAE